MKQFFKRFKNIGRKINGRSFLRDLYIFIKLWRKGFYLTYWDGRKEGVGSDAQRLCLNHDGKGRIVDVDIYRGDSASEGEKTWYVAGMQDDPDKITGACGIANKRWKITSKRIHTSWNATHDSTTQGGT